MENEVLFEIYLIVWIAQISPPPPPAKYYDHYTVFDCNDRTRLLSQSYTYQCLPMNKHSLGAPVNRKKRFTLHLFC